MKILNILSSANGSRSVSTKLAQAIVQKLIIAQPGSTVTERDLAQEPVPQLNFATFPALQTKNEDLTPPQKPPLWVVVYWPVLPPRPLYGRCPFCLKSLRYSHL